MRFQNLLFILLLSIIFTGCGSCENAPTQPTNKTPLPNTSAAPITNEQSNNDPNTNVTPQEVPSIQPSESLAPPEKIVEAVTLKPLITTYCEAMRNRDNNSLEKVFSSASLKAMKNEMRKEGLTTLHEYLETEAVGNKCQVANEEITGNTATALVITETYPQGATFKFVKENNEWKMTNESEDFDRVNEGQ